MYFVRSIPKLSRARLLTSIFNLLVQLDIILSLREMLSLSEATKFESVERQAENSGKSSGMQMYSFQEKLQLICRTTDEYVKGSRGKLL